MAINFPASPSTNDTFTEGSITYKWDGAKWIGLGVTPADRLVEGSNNLEINSSNNLVWTGGSVGIGTSSPAFPSGSGIEINSTQNPRLKLSNTSTGTSGTDGTQLYLSNDGETILDNKDSQNIRFDTGGSQTLTITPNGNLIAGADDATHPNEFAYNDTSASNNTYLELYGGTSAGNRGILSLAGRTGSDSGDLGTIWFINGNNSGTSPGSNMKLAAAIQSQSVTDNNNSQGNSGAYLQFMTKAQGGSLTEHFRFTETGKFHRPSLGTQNNPARSAQHLYDSGITSDGNYYLQSPSMTAPALVRCVFHDNRGWMIILQHECVDNDGLPITLLQNKVGTPNFSSSDFQGCEQTDGLAFTPLNMWQAFGTNGEESLMAMYAREIQTSGGSYDETQTYSSYTGGVIWSQTTFQRLFSGGFSDGVFRTSLRVTHNDGASTKYSKKGTTWSSPALATINNGNVDQDLYFCNGEDDGDSNWSFALMQGGTPYPRTANAANGGGRNSITRWAIIGICEV